MIVDQSTFASAIYHGAVRHRRYTPREHSFQYRVFMVYLDLQELDQVFAQSRWWSLEKYNLASFRRKDYGDGNTDQSLYDNIANVVEAQTGKRPAGPIRMLTNIRYFGYIINPITCYYCFDSRDEMLETVVAEVTNTPWKQRHHYVLSVPVESAASKQQFDFTKAMHVSPFQPMDLTYHWRGKTPADDLLVHIDVHRQQQPVFDATLVLERQPMTANTMNRAVFRYPWMTLKVVAGIYWQALRLAIKRIPFYSNPGSPVVANKQS